MDVRNVTIISKKKRMSIHALRIMNGALSYDFGLNDMSIGIVKQLQMTHAMTT